MSGTSVDLTTTSSSSIKTEVEEAKNTSERGNNQETHPQNGEIHVDIDKGGAGDPVFEQVFIRNPCYCECPLSHNVDWIAAFELIWGLANALVCIITLAVASADHRLPELLQAFASAGDRMNSKQEIIIKVAMSLHIMKCFLAWLLMVAADRRIRLLCIVWIVAILITMSCQLVLVSMTYIGATYMGVVTHPLKIYFIYVVWALAREIRAFPGGPPIPIVRQIAGATVAIKVNHGHELDPEGHSPRPRPTDPKKPQKKKKSAPIPILMPTCGWGYYPTYYATLDHGFYSYRHPYYLHEVYEEGNLASAIEDSRPRTMSEVKIIQDRRLSLGWSLDGQSTGGNRGSADSENSGNNYSYFPGYYRKQIN